MLKPVKSKDGIAKYFQPPLGGCVLKHSQQHAYRYRWDPAAFRRLCVETFSTAPGIFLLPYQPPLGGCVLKRYPISLTTP